MAKEHPENVELIESVHQEIKFSVKQYLRWWRIWGMVASTTALASVLASFSAGIIAATGWIPNKSFLAASIAGLPAVLLTMSQTFRFRERADWFWDLVVAYQALQRAIERKDVSYEEASRRIDEIEGKANAVDPSRGDAGKGSLRNER